MALNLNAFAVSFAREVSFTWEDRDRLIRLETKTDEGHKVINHKIGDMSKRIDDLGDLLYVVIGGMILWLQRDLNPLRSEIYCS